MSIRLTKWDREAFVRAVLDDVPSFDYQELARVKLQKWAIDHMPVKLRPLYKEYSHMFKHDQLWNLPGGLKGVMVVGDDDSVVKKAMQADAPFWAEIVKLGADLDTQATARAVLTEKVTGLIATCTTAKSVEERAPEFVKYLGVSSTTTNRTVPVVQNIVADLVAAGWPKDKKKAAQRKAA